MIFVSGRKALVGVKVQTHVVQEHIVSGGHAGLQMPVVVA